MNSFGTNYILNDDNNLEQYYQNAMPSHIMPCYSYPTSLINQNKIPIELVCSRAHLTLIMSLMSMTMLANMAHMHLPPICGDAILQLSCFGESI